jgi:DNA-binding MarR family transcriptional regulator
MAVNPASRSTVPKFSDKDLKELVRLLRHVVATLKRGGSVPPVFQQAFARSSLGPRHAPALAMIASEGELSVSELAEILGLSLSTTSLLVGELSRAGLVARAEDERDRRRTIVRLSDAYRADAEEWLQQRLEPFRRTLAALTPSQRAAFLEGWRVLAREVSRDPSRASGDREDHC